MKRRNFIRSVGAAAGLAEAAAAQAQLRTPGLRLDLHTHFYTQAYFDNIRESGGDFSFGKSPTGQTIITHRGARFFGITPPMTNVALRLEAMDRVGIDVQVISLSTPNIFYTDGPRQPSVAHMMNDTYADLVTKYPKRFKAFASIPMDHPSEAADRVASRDRRSEAQRRHPAEQHRRQTADLARVPPVLCRGEPDETVQIGRTKRG